MIWDAIIVGAGPAGCAAAYDLAAAGRRVLLLDKAHFPRPKACAGGLTAKAVQALRYPIDPVVRKTVHEIQLEHGSAPGGVVHARRRKPICVMTVRAELDAYCLEQTRRQGATFRRIGPILKLQQGEEQVQLLVEGEPDPIVGRLLLGADGVHSRVRALAHSGAGDTSWFRTGFAIEANVPYSATGRAFPLVFDFAPVPGGYGWLFPRNDHVNVGLYTAGPWESDSEAQRGAEHGSREQERSPSLHTSASPLSTGRSSAPDAPAPAEHRSAIAAASGPAIGPASGPAIGPAILDRAALAGYIAARCGTSVHERAVGQYLGFGAASYSPGQGRVLLAGDAAGFVDPLTGEGIYGAIASGQAAAAAIDASLGGPGSRSHPLRRHQLRSHRDAALLYQAGLSRLQADLGVAERAARRFYAQPARGFKWMQMPLVRQAVVYSYSEGASLELLSRSIDGARRILGALHR